MNDAARFFESYYLMWAVGMVDPEMVEELDSLSPPGVENWRQLMQRRCRYSRRELQARFRRLCETMSDEEALEVMFQGLTLEEVA